MRSNPHRTREHNGPPKRRRNLKYQLDCQHLLDALPDMGFIVSRKGKICAANQRARDYIVAGKLSLDEMLFENLIPPDDRDHFMELLTKAGATDVPLAMETELAGVGGAKRNALLSFSRYATNNAADAATVLILVRDITEEKRKELDLLRFSNVAHYTVNPLEITDVDARIIYVNPAFEKASGYSREEVLGKNPRIFGSGKHPRSFWKNMWDTVTAGKVWMGEVENRRRNGEPYYTQLLISPILNSSGEIAGYFGVHRDITGQRQLEKQLIQAQKLESIGTLAAGIAHEVGNPLTSISSLVQVIQRTTDDEFVKEKLELIKSQVQRISKIIRDLVDFSRPSSYELQLTDINTCVREAVEIVRIGKKAKGVQFHLSLDPYLPLIKIVPDQIQQVLINILMNAVDAVTDRGGARNEDCESLSVGEVFVSTDAHADTVSITIRDTGCGIPQEYIEKVFEPFFTTKGVGEGTGLGLWVSYGIIKSFHGDVRVHSELNRGTTFIITLPCRAGTSS